MGQERRAEVPPARLTADGLRVYHAFPCLRRERERERKLGAQTHIKPKLDERLLPLLTTFERHVSLEGERGLP